MRIKAYLKNIQEKLSKYFDIEKPYTYENMEYQLFAKSHVRNEKYLASKKLTIYAFENNEYTFVKTCEKLEEKNLLNFIENLKKAIEDYIDPHNEHMSTVITGVLIAEEGIEENLQRIVKKFSFSRSFAFGLKGWVYIRLLVVDFNKGEVICNKRGREIEKFYRVTN